MEGLSVGERSTSPAAVLTEGRRAVQVLRTPLFTNAFYFWASMAIMAAAGFALWAGRQTCAPATTPSSEDAMFELGLSCGDGPADEPLLHAWVRKTGLRVKEVPHRDMLRIAGNSRAASWAQSFGAVKTVVRERFRG